MSEYDKLFRTYRNLIQYKKFSDEELSKKVKEKIKSDKFEAELDLKGLFDDAKDLKNAKSLRDRYLKDNTIENISEKQDLKQLIFYEILATRYQKEINSLSKEGAGIPPKQTIEMLNKITVEISRLKSCLGLDKKEEQESDALKALQLLKKRTINYISRNQGSFSKACPHCSKMILWMFRTDKWDAKKHPFFNDERILTNPILLGWLKDGKITKEELAKFLDVSVNYIDWIIKHQKQEFDSQEFQSGTINEDKC